MTACSIINRKPPAKGIYTRYAEPYRRLPAPIRAGQEMTVKQVPITNKASLMRTTPGVGSRRRRSATTSVELEKKEKTPKSESTFRRI